MVDWTLLGFGLLAIALGACFLTFVVKNVATAFRSERRSRADRAGRQAERVAKAARVRELNQAHHIFGGSTARELASRMSDIADAATLERLTVEIEDFRQARRAKATASIRRRRETELTNWQAVSAWGAASPNGLHSRPSPKTIIGACTPEQFEYLVAFLLSMEGWYAKVTPYIGDGGVDVDVQRDGHRGIVQVKHWTNDIWIDELKSFVRLARRHRATYALFATSGRFHSEAWRYATRGQRVTIRLEIWSGGEIADKIARLDDACAYELILRLKAARRESTQ